MSYDWLNLFMFVSRSCLHLWWCVDKSANNWKLHL